MAEVGLVRIRRENNNHWDGLKIMWASKIQRAFSIDKFIFVANQSRVNPIAWLMIHVIQGKF